MTDQTPEQVRDETVQALSRRVQALTDTMREVKPKADAAVTRSQLWPRLAAVAALVLVAAVLLVAWNRVTLQQAQAGAERELSRAVTTCFLNAQDRPPAVQAACNRQFPGRKEALAEGSTNLRVFRDLIEWAKDQGWTPPAPEG